MTEIEKRRQWRQYVTLLQEVVFVLGIVTAALTGFWNFIGKPYAQDFVNATVDDRIGALEVQQRRLLAQLRILQNTAEGSQDIQSEILRLLQLGIDPRIHSGERIPGRN